MKNPNRTDHSSSIENEFVRHFRVRKRTGFSKVGPTIVPVLRARDEHISMYHVLQNYSPMIPVLNIRREDLNMHISVGSHLLFSILILST